MAHQPFETWIFAEEATTNEQARALEEHLESCAHCKALANAWADVRGSLHAPAMAMPAPGFSARWQARLAQSRERDRRRQAEWVLAGTCGGAILLSLLLGLHWIDLLRSPAGLLMDLATGLSSLVARLLVMQDLLTSLFRLLGPSALPLGGLGFVAAASAVAVLWVVSIYRFAIQGVPR